MSPGEPDDRHLMARIQQGERAALELLFSRWEGPLAAFFYRLGCPGSAIEDLTEEVLVLVYRRRHRYDTTRPFAPWLFGIARLAWKDYLRSRTHHPDVAAPLAAAEMLPSDEAGPLRSAEAREVLRSARVAIQNLPEELREVFILRHYHSLRYREIAEVLGTPIGTVKWRLHEAVRRLKASMSGLEEHQGAADDVPGSPPDDA